MSKTETETTTTTEHGKRLGATEVARKLLERRSGDRVTVELGTTARGVVTINVQVELSSNHGTEAIVAAGAAAEAEFDRLLEKYPYSDKAAEAKP